MDIACLKASNGWRERIVGLDRKAPLLDGRLVPYINLDNAETETAQWRRDPPAGDKSGKPGMVRISFGAYNNFDDVDALIEMLRRITRCEYRGQYYPNPENGEYKPAGYRDSMAEHFSLSGFTFQRALIIVPATFCKLCAFAPLRETFLTISCSRKGAKAQRRKGHAWWPK